MSMRLLVAGALLVAVVACAGRDPATAAPALGLTAPTPVSPLEQQQTGSSGSANLAGCMRTSIGATPITDLHDTYKGEGGGLYPGGSNSAPGSHVAAGMALAGQIGPLDHNGNPHPNGRYVFLSIGMSNTSEEFTAFRPLAFGDLSKSPHLVIVNGAQGGMTADDWASPSCPCWLGADQQLAALAVAPKQVVTAWVKLADASPTQPYPVHAQILRDRIVATVQNLKARYPNLKLAYLSSRMYGGYATTMLNPEPYAYESAFAVRRVIAGQLNGAPGLNFDPARGRVDAPWLAWGPYLWADGLTPRSDGLSWACSDLHPMDGTHPSNAGRRKVAELLLSFVKSDPTANIWFSR